MSLAVVYSRAEAGMLAPRVSMKVHLSNGLPAFHLVGMPEAAVRKVKSVLEVPCLPVVTSFRPSALPLIWRRQYSQARAFWFVAMGILLASKQIKVDSEVACEFAAELSLSGELRSIPSVLLWRLPYSVQVVVLFYLRVIDRRLKLFTGKLFICFT